MIQIVLCYTFHTYIKHLPFKDVLTCSSILYPLSKEHMFYQWTASNDVLQEGLGPCQGGDGLGHHVPDVQLMEHVQTQYQGRSFNTQYNNQSSFISLCRLWIIYSTKELFKTVFFHERWQNCWSRAKDKEGAIAVTNKYYALALNSNQKLTLKPKQNDTYHLDLDIVTPDTAVPPVATDCLEMTSWRTWWRWRRGWTPAGRTRGCSGGSWRPQARTNTQIMATLWPCDRRRDHQEPEQDGEGAHRPQAQSEGPQGTVRPVSDVSRGPGELQGEAYLWIFNKQQGRHSNK